MSVINEDLYYKKKDPLSKKWREFYKKNSEIPNSYFKITIRTIKEYLKKKKKN